MEIRVTDHKKILSVWDEYIAKLYDKRPDKIEAEAEKDVYEDDRAH